ncbi:hypothetical protein LN650_19110 [Klebsiella pneumoniae subsp. pneumoniae]|nr:hypothetical protein [Klebsiella pneumoniae subsp. pneumoniae]
MEFNLNGYAAGATWFRNDYKTKSFRNRGAGLYLQRKQ